MKRGEVWWVKFYPSLGGETQRTHPVVIVSNDAANQFLNRVQVVPLTASVGKLYPSEAYVTFRRKQSKAMAGQLTAVSKKRLSNRAGLLSASDLERVNQAIATQLDL